MVLCHVGVSPLSCNGFRVEFGGWILLGGFAAVGVRLDAIAGQVFSFLRGLISGPPAVCPGWADVGRSAQVDAADGAAARGGSPEVAAVRHQLAVRCGSGPENVGAVGDRGDRSAGIGDLRHRQAKEGTASAWLARQYSGTLSGIWKWQVAVGVHAVTDGAFARLDWRLYMPESWDDKIAAIKSRLVKAVDGLRRRKLPNLRGTRAPHQPSAPDQPAIPHHSRPIDMSGVPEF